MTRKNILSILLLSIAGAAPLPLLAGQEAEPAEAVEADGSAPADPHRALLQEAREAFAAYDLPRASSLLHSYAAAMKKARLQESPAAAELADAVTLADEYLERVEDIVVLDSITVDRADFFKSYRLPASAGWLADSSQLPFKALADDVDMVFTNEAGDYKLWAQPDSFGAMRIMESSRLTDGSWSAPQDIGLDIPTDADAEWPFMMADGVTLYYASDAPGGLGGLDIYIASRDAATGQYLQPKNLGMPYNSPFDDYMMAVDEENGIGWWATDRNQIEDKVTIYPFIVNDLRQNYPADTDDIAARALVADYRATWKEGEKYTPWLATIAEITPGPQETEIEFTLPAPGGIVYHLYDELPSEGARIMVKRYLDQKAQLDSKLEELSGLRRDYRQLARPATSSRIIALEKETDTLRRQLKTTRSNLYRELK